MHAGAVVHVRVHLRDRPIVCMRSVRCFCKLPVLVHAGAVVHVHVHLHDRPATCMQSGQVLLRNARPGMEARAVVHACIRLQGRSVM